MHPYIAIPATLALVYRAWSHRSLTPAGIVAAALTAAIHAIHPWSIFFVLLGVFFLSGTAVTKACSPQREALIPRETMHEILTYLPTCRSNTT